MCLPREQIWTSVLLSWPRRSAFQSEGREFRSGLSRLHSLRRRKKTTAFVWRRKSGNWFWECHLGTRVEQLADVTEMKYSGSDLKAKTKYTVQTITLYMFYPDKSILTFRTDTTLPKLIFMSPRNIALLISRTPSWSTSSCRKTSPTTSPIICKRQEGT